MPERIQSYDEFWPYYLAEHKSPVSRRLHFVGTSAWFLSLAGGAVTNPLGFPFAMAGFGWLMRRALKRGESRSPSARHLAGMVVLPTLAAPFTYPAGVVTAYGCAWIGHFVFEKNRPATFKYPIWSLVSDFKMWSHMARGRLWKGDPNAELGLPSPSHP